MSQDSTPLDEEHTKQVERAQEWLHEHGNNVGAIEQKLEYRAANSKSKPFPPPTMKIKRKIRRKDDGPMEIVCGWITEHQIGMTIYFFFCAKKRGKLANWKTIGLSINLLMLLALTHLCFPRARRHTFKFFYLSYYNPETGQYYSGWNDAFVVFFCITVFTGLRAAVMNYVLLPLAKKGGVKTARDQTRFCEQAWLLVYLSFTWTLGMVSLSNHLGAGGGVFANGIPVHIGELGILAQSQGALDELAE